MNNSEEKKETVKIEVSWKGYVALLFAIVFFSGIFASEKGLLQIFDFSALSGKFGVIKTVGKDIFRGVGGDGARDGFMFAVTLFPAVIFAMGVIEIIEHYGGLRAAQKLLTIVIRPLLGLPGIAALALIANLQSTDASAGMVRALYDEKEITDKERAIYCGFAFTGGGTITNYFAILSGLFTFFTVPIGLPLAVVFCFKAFGANMMRLYVRTVRDN